MRVNKKNFYTIIIILFIISLILYFLIPNKTYTTNHFKSIDRGLYSLEETDNITQNFISDDNYVEIGLPISNDGVYREDGKIFVEITNYKNKTKKYVIKSSELNDPNSFFYLKYKLKKNKKYIINISKNNTTTPISLFYTQKKIKNASMMINGQKQINKNLLLSFKKTANNRFNIWYILLITNILLICIVLGEEKKYEK